jgi:hypothetical protein
MPKDTPPNLGGVSWGTLLVLLLLAGTASAQQRPLLTEDPRIIPYGSVTTEVGLDYLHAAKFPFSGLVGNETSVPVLGFNFGLGPRAEFQISGSAHNFLSVTNGSGNRNDFGDFSLSTKIQISGEGHIHPMVTFRPSVLMPNSNDRKGIGTNTTDVFGDILVGKTFGRLFLFGNVGMGILDDVTQLRAQQDVLTYGLAGELRLTNRVTGVWDWHGWSNPRPNPPIGGEDRGQARVGVQLSGAGGRWDVAATAGTTHWDHKAGVVAGFTKEFHVFR